MYPSASTVINRLKTRFSTINDVKAAFAAIDKNGDGKISREEIAESEHFNSQEIDALFTLGDSNNDGEIDLEEFIGVLYPVVAQALKKFTKGRSVNLI
jgi:Ca2+-binding EF-hand superfamily protein